MAGRPRKTVAENAVEKNIEEDATVKKENNDTNVNANMEILRRCQDLFVANV